MLWPSERTFDDNNKNRVIMSPDRSLRNLPAFPNPHRSFPSRRLPPVPSPILARLFRAGLHRLCVFFPAVTPEARLFPARLKRTGTSLNSVSSIPEAMNGLAFRAIFTTRPIFLCFFTLDLFLPHVDLPLASVFSSGNPSSRAYLPTNGAPAVVRQGKIGAFEFTQRLSDGS